MVSCSGLLVPSCCGEGGALQTSVTGLCGEHSRFSGPIGFTPAQGGCVCFPCLYCSGSWLLSREQSLHCVDFPGLSRSDSGFWYSTKTQTQLGLRSVPSPVRAAQAARSLTSALSPGAERLLPSAVPASFRRLVECALCQFWGAGL